jgi:nucleotide-binding universal stress UspA family protein
MLRTLIVPLDGSAHAERALPYAERVALASGGRLVLVRVGNHAEVTEVTAYLAAVVDRVGIRAPVETVAAFGEPATEILETARRFDADQVVMASHGRTGLAHLLYGSIAEAVLAHSPVPVFLVHPHPGGVAAAQFDPRSARIMAPLDGSAFAEAALPVALEVLGAAGELVLLRVVAQDQPLEASNYLQQVANQLRQSNLDLHVTCDVRTGDAAHAIAAAQIDRGVDLVVIATHGRSGLGRALLGSVAGAVLRTGNVPVLLVRPVTVPVG